MDDRKFPRYSPEVRVLMERTDETVSAADLAPIVKMHPSVIVNYAKTGRWDLCQYVISGNRVKFFRKDFLQRCGFIPEERPERSLMEQILDELRAIREELKQLKNR